MKHIEDLPPTEFLDVVENITSYEITEKIDGVNLSFGFDADHNLFISRESKHASSQRVFDVNDWPNIGSSNTFRSAHIALQSVAEKLKECVGPNQLIEMEVLFGKQPNAIPYGAGDKSYIIFHSGLKGTQPEVVTNLTNTLDGTETTVLCPVLSSSDGVNLEVNNTEVVFKFLGPQKINIEPIKNNLELNTLVSKFNEFLLKPADIDPKFKYTNLELSELKLNTVKKEDREELKLLRSQIASKIRQEYMLPVKQCLLKLICDKKSNLSDDSTNLGIEGAVLRDPKSGSLCKIVDRNKFTALNAFIHTTRRFIGGSVKTTDPEAPLEARGGIIGHMKTQISTLIGEPEIARNSQMRRIMDTYNEDDNPVNTIKAFASVHRPDDFQGFKRKVLAIIKQANSDLASTLEKYNEQKGEYKLKFSNGQEYGYSPEVDSRTLLAFAESFKELKTLSEKIQAAKSFEVVVAILYRRAVSEVKAKIIKPQISESQLLNETRYDTDVKRYAKKDAWTLLNTYFATVFLSAMMYKANERVGLRMLKDKTNFRLERWSKEMSPLNFWGYPIWRCNSPAVKKLIGQKVAKDLHKVVKRVPVSWFRFLHMDFSFGRDVPINWVDHYKTLKVLQQYPGMNVERVNVILKGVFSFENLTFDQKVKVMNQLYYYANNFIPYSPLMIRFKLIYSDIISNREEHMLISEILDTPVKETADAGAVGVGAVNTTPMVPVFGKRIIKRQRNPAIKGMKFKKPADCPITSKKEKNNVK